MSNFSARSTIQEILLSHRLRGIEPALSAYKDGVLERRFTYADLHENVRTAATHLARVGVSRGSRVVVMSDNTPEVFFLHLAIMSMGALVAPLNPRESSRIVTHLMSAVDPQLLVYGAGVSHAALETTRDRRHLPIAELFQPTDYAPALPVPVPSDAAVMLFTSGTTSAPKGVCLSHHSLLTNARALQEAHRLDVNRVHLCMLPLFHANAFGFSMVGSVAAGNHVVLCNGFPGRSLWSIIEHEGVNIVSAVPQILQLLASSKPTRPPGPHFKYFVSAAAPLPKKVAADFVATTGVRIYQGYGLSECVNFATTTRADISDSAYEEAVFGHHAPSIGSPLSGCDVSVQLPNNSSAAPGEVGEIVVTGDTLMQGYWQDKAATDAAIVDGWLHTGDLGYYQVIEGKHYFFITGRIKELIIRAGEKISPLAVEADLADLRAYGSFAVGGFANEATGEEVGLYLATQAYPQPTAIANILRNCSVGIRPRLVVIGTDPIPVTPTGKVRREALAQRFRNYASHVFGSEPLVIRDPIHLPTNTST